MEEFDDIKKIWNENKPSGQCSPEYIDNVVSMRIKKVKSSFREYFWLSFIYQNMVYASLVFLIAKFFSRTDIVILSIAGILVYLPFTIVFMRKFKTAFLNNSEGLAFSENDIYLNIKNSHSRISEFFRFKKRFDWVMIPLNCVLIVVINFILFVPGGIMDNLIVGALLFFVWLIIFIIAIRSENKKRFSEPLQQLGSVLEEFRVDASV